MKKIFLFQLFTALTVISFGQINLDNYITTYSGDGKDKKPMIIVATLNNGIYSTRFDEDDFPNFKDEKLEKDSIETLVVNTLDSSNVYFFVSGIYRNNTKDYEFRITENRKKVIVSWRNINQFAVDSIQINDFKKGMAYLGGYKTTLGNYLFVEIRKKATIKPLETMVVFWRQTKPEILNIYSANQFNTFLKRLKQTYDFELIKEEKDVWTSLYPPNQIDTLTGLPKKLILEVKEDNPIFFIKGDNNHIRALEYKVIKNGKVFLDWQANDFDNNFIWLKNLKYGEYGFVRCHQSHLVNKAFIKRRWVSINGRQCANSYFKE